MRIRLKIENVDRLADGGPIAFEAEDRSFEIGRANCAWTLPDPNLFISGRQCEVRYENGAYWLYDLSRNGTFLNGAKQRMKSPWRLVDGDRLRIGHYLISVALDGGAAEPPPARAPWNDDIWSGDGSGPAPISRQELMPPRSRGQRAADFSEQFLEFPSFGSDTPGVPADPRRGRPAPGGVPEESPFARMPAGSEPGGPPMPAPPLGSADPFLFEAKPFPAAPAPPAPRAAAPAAARPGSASSESLLRTIAAGAGVSPDLFAQRDADEVATEIGAVLRLLVDELALLLKARAAAKTLARSGERTMLGALDNNPLKFVPRAEEVLDIMFARRRAGYLDARQSVGQAFRDLKAHEFATYSAMQAALGRLLDDISPETIERGVPSSALSSKKARAWESYVQKWQAMEKPHENGMLDVFLAYFAEAYAKAQK
jgi:type VI secretion system protein ImpI